MLLSQKLQHQHLHCFFALSLIPVTPTSISMATKDKPNVTSPNTSTISIAELLNSSSQNCLVERFIFPGLLPFKHFLLLRRKSDRLRKTNRGGWCYLGKENAWVWSWLRNIVEPHVSYEVMLPASDYAVWTSLKETYGQEGNIQRIYELREGIFLTKQGSRPLHKLYSSVKSKWEELNLYQPYPGDLDTWKKQREELKVISFLVALGPHYESSKDQFLTGIDLPSLNATGGE